MAEGSVINLSTLGDKSFTSEGDGKAYNLVTVGNATLDKSIGEKPHSKVFNLTGNGENNTTSVRRLVRIAVTRDPKTTKYRYGATFDRTNMVVYAYYSDGSGREIEYPNYRYSPEIMTHAFSTVTIYYTEGGITRTAEVEVTVTAILYGIRITTNPTQMEYTVGNSFNPEGAVVKAIYSDSSTKEDVASECTWEPTKLSSTGTAIKVTATYTDGEDSASDFIYVSVQTASADESLQEIPIPDWTNTDLTYDGSVKTPEFSNYDPEKMDMGGTTEGTDAGQYYAKFTVHDGYIFERNGQYFQDAYVNWNISKAKISSSELPQQSGTLEYTGEYQTPEWDPNDPDKYSIDVTPEKNGGSHTATVTPGDNYEWEDGTSDPKEVTWEISPADVDLYVDPHRIYLTDTHRSESIDVYVSFDEAGDIIAKSLNENAATIGVVDQDSKLVEIQLVNGASDYATVEVYTEANENCNESNHDECWVTVYSESGSGSGGPSGDEGGGSDDGVDESDIPVADFDIVLCAGPGHPWDIGNSGSRKWGISYTGNTYYVLQSIPTETSIQVKGFFDNYTEPSTQAPLLLACKYLLLSNDNSNIDAFAFQLPSNSTSASFPSIALYSLWTDTVSFIKQHDDEGRQYLLDKCLGIFALGLQTSNNFSQLSTNELEATSGFHWSLLSKKELFSYAHTKNSKIIKNSRNTADAVVYPTTYSGTIQYTRGYLNNTTPDYGEYLAVNLNDDNSLGTTPIMLCGFTVPQVGNPVDSKNGSILTGSSHLNDKPYRVSLPMGLSSPYYSSLVDMSDPSYYLVAKFDPTPLPITGGLPEGQVPTPSTPGKTPVKDGYFRFWKAWGCSYKTASEEGPAPISIHSGVSNPTQDPQQYLDFPIVEIAWDSDSKDTATIGSKDGSSDANMYVLCKIPDGIPAERSVLSWAVADLVLPGFDFSTSKLITAGSSNDNGEIIGYTGVYSTGDLEYVTGVLSQLSNYYSINSSAAKSITVSPSEVKRAYDKQLRAVEYMGWGGTSDPKAAVSCDPSGTGEKSRLQWRLPGKGTLSTAILTQEGYEGETAYIPSNMGSYGPESYMKIPDGGGYLLITIPSITGAGIADADFTEEGGTGSNAWPTSVKEALQYAYAEISNYTLHSFETENTTANSGTPSSTTVRANLVGLMPGVSNTEQNYLSQFNGTKVQVKTADVFDGIAYTFDYKFPDALAKLNSSKNYSLLGFDGNLKLTFPYLNVYLVDNATGEKLELAADQIDSTITGDMLSIDDSEYSASITPKQTEAFSTEFTDSKESYDKLVTYEIASSGGGG